MTQLISMERGQTALLCCAGIADEGIIPVHHCQLGWKSDQLQGGRDVNKDRPLRYQHLLLPPRKLKLCSFDVKTEFMFNPSLLKQAGNSISCSYGNTVSIRDIHGEKWFSRRLDLSQRQATVSSQQSTKLLLNKSWSHGKEIPIISLCHRAEEWERRNPALPVLCMESQWLLWFNCNHFKHWKHIFVFARTILVSSPNVTPHRRTFLTRKKASWYEGQDSFWTQLSSNIVRNTSKPRTVACKLLLKEN